MTHDKISFAREYCRCRRIPYRIKGESLYIGEFHFNAVCYSLFNHSYADIMKMIDNEVIYDEYGFFESLAIPQF